ncbi:uncharacterized protein LOC111697552 isoform X3 [Eurytemora carolleeae]|uniref:uncharacterized protein LOC111697552 isoform X3 n=1 Tax=Eurytemora carolleeae TaxID=1294199 RepID=UPI000C761369|nr:uncharacterized protein LOC111697552 isoform X3 [Eurytemora carolleeae]|eukprot:XP_023323357.1 uncharacterized protein LOC111697552 isoform X3 [Eurytemora affinis]
MEMVFKVPPLPLPRNQPKEKKGQQCTSGHRSNLQGRGASFLQAQGLDQIGLGPRVQPYRQRPQFPLQPSSSNQCNSEQTLSSIKHGSKGKENKKVRFDVGISDRGISKRRDSKVLTKRVNLEKIMNIPAESVKWRPSSNLKSSYEGSVDPIFHRYRDFQDVLALEISKSIISVDETVAEVEEGFDETLNTIFANTLDIEGYKEKIEENIGRNLEKIFNPIISKLQNDIVNMKERNQTILEGVVHQREQSSERIYQLNSLLSNLSLSVESSKSRKKKEVRKEEENRRFNQLEDTLGTSNQKAADVEKSRTGIDEAGVEASVEAIDTLEASIASETLDALNAIDTPNSLNFMPALDEYQTDKNEIPEKVLKFSPVVPGGYREELINWLDNYSQMTYSPNIYFSNPTPLQPDKNTQPDNPQSNLCSNLNPPQSNQKHHPTSQLSNHCPPPSPPNSNLSPPQSNMNPDPSPSQSNQNSDTILLQFNQNLDTISSEYNQNLDTMPPRFNQNTDTIPAKSNPLQSNQHSDPILLQSSQGLDPQSLQSNQRHDPNPLKSNLCPDPNPIQSNQRPDHKPLQSDYCPDPNPVQSNQGPYPKPLQSDQRPDPNHLQSFPTPNPTQLSIVTQPSLNSELFNDSNSSPELSTRSCSFSKVIRSRNILKTTMSVNQPMMNHGKNGRKFGNAIFSSSSDESSENKNGGPQEIRGHVVKTPKSRIQSTLNLGKNKLENYCLSTSSEDSDENDHLLLDDPVKGEVVKQSKNHDHHEISKSGSYSGRDHYVQNTNPFELLDFSSSSSVELDDDWKTTALQDSSEDEVENDLSILKIQINDSGMSGRGEGVVGRDGVSEKGESAGGRDGVSENGESVGGNDGVSRKGEGAGERDGLSGNIEKERGLKVPRRTAERVPVLTKSSSESDTD